MISPEAIAEFKQIYLKHYGTMLTDEQVLDLGTKLIELFKVIARPIPQVQIDKKGGKINNDRDD